MTKERFWEIMDRCRDADTTAFFENLEREVAKLDGEDVPSFPMYASAYMQAASECVWLDMACKVVNGYVSDDTALYFTLWVIAQGEEVLLAALKDPDSLAKLPEIPFGNAEFEFLMGVGCGEDGFDDEVMEYEKSQALAGEIEKAIVFKDGDKYGGYASFEDAMNDIPNVLPALIRRAEEAGFNWKSMYAL